MDEQTIQAAYEKLKAEQERLEPVLSIRHMAETLGNNSISFVQELLVELVRRGLVKRVRPTGGVNKYRIL